MTSPACLYHADHSGAQVIARSVIGLNGLNVNPTVLVAWIYAMVGLFDSHAFFSISIIILYYSAYFQLFQLKSWVFELGHSRMANFSLPIN